MTKTVKGANKALEKKATKAPSKKDGFRSTVMQMEPEIRRAVTNTPLNTDRFMRLMFSALSENPKLANCTQASLLGAMMSSAQLGLEPNTPAGQAYLIPYGNKVQFIIGYRGLIDLAYRSGRVESINAETVYENDYFEYELGWNRDLKHRPLLSGDRGEPIAFYATVKLKGGGGNFFIMSVEDAKKYGQKYSKSYRGGPWQTNFEAMAKKTCIRQALKYAPLGVEMQKALTSDETVKNVEINDLNQDFNILDKEPEYMVENEESEITPDNSELLNSNNNNSRVIDSNSNNSEKVSKTNNKNSKDNNNSEDFFIDPETGEIFQDEPAPFEVDQGSFIK